MPRFITEKPEIITFCLESTNNCSESLVVTETFDETLKCEVSASPEALVYWSYLGSDRRNANQPLDTRERRMIDNHDGRLRIRDLRRNDTGYYRCYANNSVGDDELVLHLRVKGKLEIVILQILFTSPYILLMANWGEFDV